MHKVIADPQRTCLYPTFRGVMHDEKVKQASHEIITAVSSLKPGFTVGKDMADFNCVSPQSLTVFQEAMTAIFQKGIARAIRIGASTVALMQFTRAQQGIGAEYEVLEVQSMKEAERLIAQSKTDK